MPRISWGRSRQEKGPAAAPAAAPRVTEVNIHARNQQLLRDTSYRSHEAREPARSVKVEPQGLRREGLERYERLGRDDRDLGRLKTDSEGYERRALQPDRSTPMRAVCELPAVRQTELRRERERTDRSPLLRNVQAKT